ncbi:MAG: radical SAM protein [Thermodesulfobacteriota bacterium]
MRIDLLFPGISLIGFNSFGHSAVQEASFMHHGIASISAYLKSKGHEPTLTDLRRLRNWADVEEKILRTDAKVFGLSTMSCDYGIASTIAALIKKRRPDSITVVGGVHPTVATGEVVENTSFDHIITGEGEYSLCRLLEELEQGRKPDRLIRGESVDLAALPWVDREVFAYQDGEARTPLLPHMRQPFVTIMTSRGCPYRCRFCQPAERMVFGNRVKIRPLEDVLGELLHLRERYRFESFLVHDDLFILKPHYVEEFVAEYKRNGFHQPFACQARADIIVQMEERIRMLAESGLDCLMVGFESGSQRMLDFMEKGTTVEQNRRAVEICRRYGIRLYANMMFGLPTETRKDMDATVDFIRWMKPDYLSCAVFTPYPGTYLYEYCKERSLLMPFSHQSYRRDPLSGAKVRGVNYRLVHYELLRAAPYKLIGLWASKLAGFQAVNHLSKAKHRILALLRGARF